MSNREGAAFYKVVDGVEIVVYPMTFGKGRVCVGIPGAYGYDDAWCYPHLSTAIKAAQRWNGEGDPPVGWSRHIGSGRRRPDGDPAREHVAP